MLKAEDTSWMLSILSVSLFKVWGFFGYFLVGDPGRRQAAVT